MTGQSFINTTPTPQRGGATRPPNPHVGNSAQPSPTPPVYTPGTFFQASTTAAATRTMPGNFTSSSQAAPPPPPPPPASGFISTPRPMARAVPATASIPLPPSTSGIISSPAPMASIASVHVPVIQHIIVNQAAPPPPPPSYDAKPVDIHCLNPNNIWVATFMTPTPRPLPHSAITVVSWSIGSALPSSSARITKLLAAISTTPSDQPPILIFFQDVHRDSIPTIMNDPLVRRLYHISDVDASKWGDQGATGGIVALIRKDLQPANVFRVYLKPFTESGRVPNALFLDFLIPETPENRGFDYNNRIVRFGTTWFPAEADAKARVGKMATLCEFVPGNDTLGGLLVGEVGASVSPPAKEKAEEKLKDAFLKMGGSGAKGDTWGFCCTPPVSKRQRRTRAFYGGAVRLADFGRIGGDGAEVRMSDGSFASENCGVVFKGRV